MMNLFGNSLEREAVSLTATINKSKDTRTTDYIGFRLFDQWIRAKRNGYRIEQFFEDNLYKTVVIYGIGIIGKQIFEELSRVSSVHVLYGIDQKADMIDIDGLRVIKTNEVYKEEKPDVVVVTPVQYYWDIEPLIKEQVGNVDVISVETVVNYSKWF